MKETFADFDTTFSVLIGGDWESLKRELETAFPLSRWQRIRLWVRRTVGA